MAFPFSVGNSAVQEVLDWVAQPPPAQGRDTHVVDFNLIRREHEPLEYNGSMFFRPQGTGHGPVGVRPGLDGFGSLLVREGVCQALLDTTTVVQPADLVKVFLGFRQRPSGPADVVATLTFMNRDPVTHLPLGRTRTLEFSVVQMSGVSAGIIDMDNWHLDMVKTTVLFRS